jgi:hypothetical protein
MNFILQKATVVKRNVTLKQTNLDLKAMQIVVANPLVPVVCIRNFLLIVENHDGILKRYKLANLSNINGNCRTYLLASNCEHTVTE